MTKQNSQGVYINAHSDKNGKSHVDIYDGDPRGSHSTIHINVGSDGKGNIVETDSSGNKTTTNIDLNKRK